MTSFRSPLLSWTTAPALLCASFAPGTGMTWKSRDPCIPEGIFIVFFLMFDSFTLWKLGCCCYFIYKFYWFISPCHFAVEMIFFCFSHLFLPLFFSPSLLLSLHSYHMCVRHPPPHRIFQVSVCYIFKLKVSSLIFSLIFTSSVEISYFCLFQNVYNYI